MAQAGLHIPAAPGSPAAGLPQRVRRHRRRAVDRRQPEHLLVARHQHRVDGPDAGAAGARAVRRARLRAPTRPRAARSATAVVDHFKSRGALVVCTTPQRGGEDLRDDDAGCDGGGVRLRPGDVRAHLPAGLRLAGPQPGARDRRPPRAGPGDPRHGAPEPERARRAAGRAPGQIDQNLHDLEHERRLVARERQAIAESESRLKAARRGAAPARGDVPPQDRGAARRAAARRAARDRQGDRRPQEEGGGDDRGGRAAAVEADVHAGRRFRPATPAPPASRRARRSKRPRRGSTAARAAAARAGVGRRAGRRWATAWSSPASGSRGSLAALHGDDAEVDMQGKRLRARVADLRLVAKAGAAAPKRRARVNVNVQLQPRGDETVGDLNVIGCTVDEALARTERFLDETLLTDQRDGPGHPRLRHRAAAARDRRVPEEPPAGGELPAGGARAGRRRRDGGGTEGVGIGAVSPRPSSTTCGPGPTSSRSCRTTCR